MLTPARRRPRALLTLVTFFGVIASLLIMTHAQAEPGEGADTTVASSAEVSEGGCSVPPGHYESVWNAEKNRLETITVCPPTGGENGTGDGGGGNEPTCEYYQNYDEWCEGTAACWGNNPAANQPEDLSPEDNPGPPPSDEHNLAYKECRRPDGSTYDDWYWAVPPEPPLWQQAQEAFANLVAPTFTLKYSPDQLTFVGADTFFWVDGAIGDEIRGESAFGVVAIASLNRVEVDPGDGSGTLNCGKVTAKSESCVKTYMETSAGAGGAAFPARARLVYDVRYTNNGAPLDISGMPNVAVTFTTAYQGTPVPVGEVQVIVE